MGFSIGKSAPTVAVVSVVSYCVWSSASSLPLGGAEGQDAKTPRIAAAQLSPRILPPPGRDPFRALDAAGPAQTAASPAPGQTKAKLPGTTGKAAGGTAARPAPPRTAAVPRTAAAARGRQDPASVATRVLSLNAISICGGQRAAIINGRLYAPGATLLAQDQSASPNVVREILPDRVLLESKGRTSELTFSNTATGAGRPAKASKTATTTRAASGTSKTAQPTGRAGARRGPSQETPAKGR